MALRRREDDPHWLIGMFSVRSSANGILVPPMISRSAMYQSCGKMNRCVSARGTARLQPTLADNSRIEYAYYLNDSGAAIVEDAAAAFSKESQIIPRHEIEITQFHLHLKQWAERQGFTLDWHQPKTDYKRDINPDAYFGLQDPKLPAGHDTLHYFLEIERAPLGNYLNGDPSIVRKLQKYYDFFDSTECEKEWGFRKFRVIWGKILGTDEGVEELVEKMKRPYTEQADAALKDYDRAFLQLLSTSHLEDAQRIVADLL